MTGLPQNIWIFRITIELKSSCDTSLSYCKNIIDFLFWVLWTCLAKSTSSLTSCLRYCKDIANLLFWDLWECLTILSKTIVLICKKPSCSYACKKWTSRFTFFIKILQRNSKLVISGTLEISSHTHLKW